MASIENLVTLSYLWLSYLLEKTLVLYIICGKCKNEEEKTFKEESIDILKVN